jgi:hypothetical protein
MTWYSCEEKFDLKRTEKEKLFDLFFLQFTARKWDEKSFNDSKILGFFP